jgi:NitT/TauT family transport system permease protein
MLDVGRSLGASQRRIFTTIVLPSTVPFMIAGVRLGIGRGLAGVVVAEFYAQTKGVGVIIVKAGQSLDSSRLLMGVLIFTMSAIVMAFLVGLVEGRVERWRPGLDSEEGGA